MRALLTALAFCVAAAGCTKDPPPPTGPKTDAQGKPDIPAHPKATVTPN